MGDTVIIRRTVRRDFTTLPNELIRDNRLSWAALGLLVYVLSLPNDFRLRLSHLAKQKTSGRDATRSAAKVLECAGYLKIRQQRGYHGRFTQTTWEVTDTPDAVVDVGISPRSGFPNTVDPTTDKPHPGNPTLPNTYTQQELNVTKTTTTKAAEIERTTIKKRLDIDFSISPRLGAADLKSIDSVIQTKLATAPKSDVQLMLDELSSAIEGGAIQTTPGQYFAGIAGQYANGKFTPIGAHRVAQRRERERNEAASTEQPARASPTPTHIAKRQLALLKQQLSTK